jgi:hypothetical protein
LRLLGIGLGVLIGAALTLGAGSGADARSAAAPQAAKPSALVFLVNPSRRAHNPVFRHAQEIVREVARPELSLIGFYEQVTADDGAPFDRAFIQTRSPSVGPEPRMSPAPDCSHGTRYQRDKCAKDYESRHGDEIEAHDRWQAATDRALAAWKNGAIGTLRRVAAAGRTHESPSGVWNLRKGLTDAGQIIQALNAPTRCVVLLGGLAVRQPPPRLPTGVLADTTLVVAGWRGTPKVQSAWRRILEPVGASIVFLPEAITELQLVDSVRGCLDSGGLR